MASLLLYFAFKNSKLQNRQQEINEDYSTVDNDNMTQVASRCGASGLSASSKILAQNGSPGEKNISSKMV